MPHSPQFDLLHRPTYAIDIARLGEVYATCFSELQRIKPDIVICPFDRPEILMVALSAFHLNIPIASLYSGDKPSGACWDGTHRSAISLYANICFCNGEEATKRTKELSEVAGLQKGIFNIGSIAFDGIEVDEDLVPKDPYDLVLYNPPTKHPEAIEGELKQIEQLLDKRAYWIEPNGDVGSDWILAKMAELERVDKIWTYPTLPREIFLGLMKSASRFIGNSSSQALEAPLFLKDSQIIHIGLRNKERERTKIVVGGVGQIIKHLKGHIK
jgi:UDP-N-acetylglucosamine 2-epimerase